MTKYLVLLLVLAVAYGHWRAQQRRAQSQRAQPPTQPPASNPPAQQPMLACAHCGLHLQRQEALLHHGQVY